MVNYTRHMYLRSVGVNWLKLEFVVRRNLSVGNWLSRQEISVLDTSDGLGLVGECWLMS
jgi:hypothetical protein